MNEINSHIFYPFKTRSIASIRISRYSTSKILSALTLSLLFTLTNNVLANQTGPNEEKIRTGNLWVLTKAPCHALLMRYVDWHAIAFALGDDINEDEHNWLKETGLVNAEDRQEFFENYVKPVQSTKSIKSVAATCSGNPLREQFSGELIVNSTLSDGQLMTSTFIQQGPDSYTIENDSLSENADAAEFSPLLQTYLSQLSFNKAYYQQIIDQLNTINESKLKFSEDIVDLWYDWPAGILMSSVKDVVVETFENDQDDQSKISEQTMSYKTALTKTDAGVRLSSQYAGLPVYTQTSSNSEADTKKRTQERVDYCIESLNKHRGCWVQTHGLLPYHYSINKQGDISEPIIDDLYLTVIETFIRESFSTAHNVDEYAAKMVDYLKREAPTGSLRPLFVPLEEDLPTLHGKTLKKGETYTNYINPLRFSNRGISLPIYYASRTDTTMKYLGKIPCHAEDTEAACVHIEYRLKNSDATQDKTVAQLAVDLILEPHTLLLHKVDYNLLSTVYHNKDKARLKTKNRYIISIKTRYEDLPE